MTWIALVGPETAQRARLAELSLRLQRGGQRCAVVEFRGEYDFDEALRTLMPAAEPPSLIGLWLASACRAPDTLALAVALRERGYRGSIVMNGPFGSIAGAKLLRDFPEIDSVVHDADPQTWIALASAPRPEPTERLLLGAPASLATRGALTRRPGFEAAQA